MLSRLNDLLAHEDERALCYRDFQGDSCSVTTLRSDMAALRRQVESVEAEAWLLYTDDTYLFAVGLLTLLGLRKTVVISASDRPGWISQFSGDFGAILSDRRLIVAGRESLQIASGESGGSPWSPVFDGAERIVFFTSGSTGQAKPVEKRLSALLAEVETLERQFGKRVKECAVLASVTHQHIYGLLFKLLWPLLGGRPWVCRTIEYQEQIGRAILGAKSSILVSSPAFLSRLDEHLPRVSLACVFSSGGPLAFADSRRALGQFGSVPIEVYGSTETGGIAWRIPESEGEVWTQFQGIEITQEPDGYQLDSPHLPADTRVLLDDDLSLLGARKFVLRGRRDRVVKVEEKRVSLTSIERHLELHDSIERCVALTMTNGRTVIACAVALSAAGRKLLDEKGRRFLVSTWRRHCHAQFESVTRPRKWRIMTAQCLNSQGKVDMQQVADLFNTRRESRPGVPDVTHVERSDNAVEIHLHIREDLTVFDGHFDDAPVVPGVVQVKWAIDFASQYLLDGYSGPGVLKSVKFQQVMLPGQDVVLKLTIDHDRLDFNFCSAGRRHSSGKVEMV